MPRPPGYPRHYRRRVPRADELAPEDLERQRKHREATLAVDQGFGPAEVRPHYEGPDYYRAQFPHFPPGMPEFNERKPDTFEDCSFHNDGSPSLVSESKGLHIFVDHPDPAMRFRGPEGDDSQSAPRYVVSSCPGGMFPPEPEPPILETDDWEAVLTVIRCWRAGARAEPPAP
jgi:hypothetical protein